MAIPTPVNGQITDAITQANITVLGNAPAQAMGSLSQVLAQCAGLAAQNAVANQQTAHTLATAVTTKCVNALLDPSKK